MEPIPREADAPGVLAMTASRQEAELNRPSGAEELARRATHFAILLPGAFLLIAFFGIPLLIILGYSIGSLSSPTLDNYQQVMTRSIYVSSFARTALYATAATIIALLASYPVAYYLARRSRRGGIILVLILIPFATSIVLRVLAWKVILGSTSGGIINAILLALGVVNQPISFLFTGAATVFGLVYLSIPFMILPLYGVLGKVPDSLLEASEDLGATRIQTFFRVVVPLTRSGTLTAVMLAFMVSLGDVLASQTLGGGRELMIGAVMFQTFLRGSNWNVGSALAVTVFAAMLLIAGILGFIGREPKRRG